MNTNITKQINQARGQIKRQKKSLNQAKKYMRMLETVRKLDGEIFATLDAIGAHPCSRGLDISPSNEFSQPNDFSK